ncbi:MAG TPA: tetratricopeptide repeat protein [Gammaproteobacteria bacterium]|nr:tetratricopeptide repeat protein [Gammaproteobacteria bacterium]
MVDEYLSDEERLEMAKKWWLENYKSILAGAIIAAAVVGGWRYWQYRTLVRSQTAAMMFDQLTGSMTKQDKDGAVKTGNELMDKYADTPYAAHAALALAQLQASTGKPADGEQMLDWVIKNSKDDGLKLLARLRLARVKLATNDAQGALDTLNGADAGGFAPLYATVRGDAYAKLGKNEEARAAYQQALQAWSDNLGDRSLIEMKLNSLPAKAHKP